MFLKNRMFLCQIGKLHPLCKETSLQFILGGVQSTVKGINSQCYMGDLRNLLLYAFILQVSAIRKVGVLRSLQKHQNLTAFSKIMMIIRWKEIGFVITLLTNVSAA